MFWQLNLWVKLNWRQFVLNKKQYSSSPAYLRQHTVTSKHFTCSVFGACFLTFKDSTCKVAADVMSYQVKRHHQEWFDENDTEARALLDNMYAHHLTWIIDKNSIAKKTAYTKAWQSAQVKL